ncbi:MAG: GNAT family N-acetyltransferase [Oscillospiraceae bacterium]|jgi:ribosomal protein S18 acetylase RimI-like enzyme|nr:GNAT family N-acetyltransferase [Oscillospiraceae bacterium]
MYNVREITPEEIPQSAEIIRQSFKTVADEFGITEENTPTHGTFMKDEKLQSDFNAGIKMFGLFEWEKQVGFVAAETRDGENYYVEKLAVLPDYRHRRGGKDLMKAAEEYIRNAGGKLVSIGIIYENKMLLEWYKMLGYEETGTKNFPNFPFTVCFMKKEIQ